MWQAEQYSTVVVEVLHDCFGVPVEMGEDLFVGDFAVDGLIVFVDEDCGLREDVAAGAAGVDPLDRVTDRAGDAVFIELAVDGRALGDGSGDQRSRVMAALAVTGELDAFLRNQEVDVLRVPRGAEGVGVGGLAPFGVGFLVAVAAVLRGGEGFGVDELAGVGGGERGEEGLIGAEAVVVVLGYRLGVDLALLGGGGVVLGVGTAGAQGHDAAGEASAKEGADEDTACSLRENLGTMAEADFSEVESGVGYPSKGGEHGEEVGNRK